MGFVYVVLEDKGTDLLPLTLESGQSYPSIPLAPTAALSLDSSFREMNQQLQKITALFQSVFDKETIKSLKYLLHNMENVSNSLAMKAQQLDSILINMEKASYQLEPFLKSGQRTMAMLNTEFRPFIKTAQGTMTTLEPFLVSTQNLVTILETHLLPQVQRTLSSVQGLSDSALNLTRDIKQDPSILIRGTMPPVPGPGESHENK